MLERLLEVEFQLPENSVAKKCPTTRSFKVLEFNDSKLVMKVVSKCNDVPYADDYNIEEEWYVACLPSSTNSCCLRISSKVNFEKFTMMKSIIK
jgi:hypothetical protein